MIIMTILTMILLLMISIFGCAKTAEPEQEDVQPDDDGGAADDSVLPEETDLDQPVNDADAITEELDDSELDSDVTEAEGDLEDW